MYNFTIFTDFIIKQSFSDEKGFKLLVEKTYYAASLSEKNITNADLLTIKNRRNLK